MATAWALIAMLLVGFQAGDEKAEPWETVVSREGQFVVDFPTKPTESKTETRRGPGGRFQVVSVACETPTAAYIAQKINLPTAFVRGAEEQALDSFRDYFAELFQGKVLTEKKVKLETNPGRDFTVRGRAKGEKAISTVRVRQYVAGRVLYALIAVSADNRELPPEAGRFFGSFSVGTSRARKSGPKGDVKGTDLAGWGKAIDPDGDCKIHAEGKALVIAVPGTLHDLNADIDTFNSPRVLVDVDGDFTATVKVVGEFKPGAKSLKAKTVPYVGGGLFVWRDSDNYIFLERAAILRNNKPATFAHFEEREGGSRGATHNGALPAGTAYLRLERRGARVSGFVSRDGKRWSALKPIDTVWPGDLKVGLNAMNTSDAPFTVRFEDFRLTDGRGKPIRPAAGAPGGPG